MGLDLRLLPMYSQSKTCYFSHDILQMERDSDLFYLIEKVEKSKGVDVQKGGINSFSGKDESGQWEELCYAKTKTNPYGGKLKSLLAGELHKIFSKYEPKHGIMHWRNEAVFAYVKALPKDLPIYLYWH